MKFKSVLTFWIFVLIKNVFSEGIFSIVGSSVMKFQEQYKVIVNAHGFSQETVLEISIIGDLDNDGKYENSQNVTLVNDVLQVVNFDLKDQKLGNYKISTRDLGGKLSFKPIRSLHLAFKKYSVFIQTDKAIYKPGDRVLFRVLLLDPQTRPLSAQNVTIYFKDGANNRIKQLNQVQFANGMYQNELQIATEPVLGKWAIVVVVNDDVEKSQVFEVAEYDLPLFQVIITTKPKIKLEDTMIVNFDAKYTFGKTITNGTATITLEMAFPWWDSDSFKLTKTQELNQFRNTFEVALKKELEFPIYFSRDVKVTVAVKDFLTGKEQNSSTIVTLFKILYTISFINEDGTIKPGLPFHLKLIAKDFDGAPVNDSKTPVVLTIRYYSEVMKEPSFDSSTSVRRPFWMREFTTTEEERKLYFVNGITSFTLTLPNNITSLSISALYKETYGYFGQQVIEAQNKKLIKLRVTNKCLSIFRPIEVEIDGNNNLGSITFLVLARNQIVYSSTIKVNNAKRTEFKFSPTFEMAPLAQLVAYYLTEEGEIVSDSLNLNIDVDLLNMVHIDIAAQAQPGDVLNISVVTLPNSFVALLGVDQSVLLLKDGNDIGKDTVINDLAEYGNIDRYNFPDYNGFHDESYIDFNGVNMIIISNAKENKRIDYEYENGMVDDEAPSNSPQPPPVNEGNELVVRKNFPETWLFESFFNSQGFTNLSKKVPDTITSWIITGFSINSVEGLGLTRQPSKLTVFQPFFVKLILPFAVKRGEIVSIDIVVYNYMNTGQRVNVTLFNDFGEFEFVNTSQEPTSLDKKSQDMFIFIPLHSGSSVSFMIRPLKVGHITIKARAICALAGDAIERQLLVKAEGVTKYENTAVFIDLRNNPDFRSNISIKIPSDAVPDSTKIEASAIGDILGPSIENLDNLIRMPYGCGEQNMLNFVPNIVVIDYLTSLNKLTPEIESKAKKFMEAGYQGELRYKRVDGSYSAFGMSDNYGSTWLTAFVAKSFHEASKYITVESDIINQALDFLKKNQAKDGSFPEMGKVWHQDMQGGSSKGLALTAYTLITLLEVQSSTHQNATKSALDFISKNFDALDDVYALAISTYAFQLAKHEAKDLLMMKLDEQAIVKNGMRYWEKKLTSAENGAWIDNTNSINVELTAYALLAYIEAGRDTEAIPVMKWLITQRNVNGGFQSTQDTMVGLRALSKIANKLGTSQNKINISLSLNVGKEINFDINESNALILQKYELPSLTRDVHVHAQGKGSTVLQVSYEYNLNGNQDSPRFLIQPQVNLDSNHKNLEIYMCIGFVADRASNKSNMAVVEIEFPSGFIFDAESAAKIKENSEVKKVETKSGATVCVIYLDEIAVVPTCLNVTAFQSHGVAQQKPASIVVYDYYDTSRRATKFYDAPTIELCDICDDVSCHSFCRQ